MKILWSGPVFNPTGIATSAREMIKALVKLGHQVQVLDPYNSTYDFCKGMENLNNAIDVKDLDLTFIYDYPQFWRKYPGKKTITHFLHEGTKIWPEWTNIINGYGSHQFTTCSKPIKNLFKFNGVIQEPKVIPYGVSEIYKPADFDNGEEFIFLSVNSWTGEPNDRKGTDLLIKAFHEEFKNEPNVKLLLKISTFWDNLKDEYYAKKINQITGEVNQNIYVNSKYVNEEDLVTYYQKSDCFVAPTRGEGFGLTILNALACDLPVIVTKDNNSGHMDFCRGNPSVLFVDAPGLIQGDERFYIKGNMLTQPDLSSLRKQMRYAYENRKEMKQKAKEGGKMAREWTWEKSAQKIVNIANGS